MCSFRGEDCDNQFFKTTSFSSFLFTILIIVVGGRTDGRAVGHRDGRSAARTDRRTGADCVVAVR